MHISLMWQAYQTLIREGKRYIHISILCLVHVINPNKHTHTHYHAVLAKKTNNMLALTALELVAPSGKSWILHYICMKKQVIQVSEK